IQFWRDLQAAAQASGEFETISTAVAAPFGGASRFRIQPPGPQAAEAMMVGGNGVSDSYFRTLKIRLLSGREFTADEAFGPSTTLTPPIIVNEAMARR